MYEYIERHDEDHVSALSWEEANPRYGADKSGEKIGLLEIKDTRITIARGLSHRQIQEHPFMYDPCYVIIEGRRIPLLKCWNGTLHILAATWDSLPLPVLDHFILHAKNETNAKKRSKRLIWVKPFDPACVKVVIQADNIRSICSQRAQFTDGNNSWPVPCRELPQYNSIQVPATLFQDTVPEATIMQLIRKKLLTDPHGLLPKSLFREDLNETQPKEEQPSIETVPDSVAASYFSEAFISQAEQQAPAMWKLWQKSRQIFIFEEELCSSLLLNVNSIKTVRCETIRSIPYAAGYIVGGASDLEFFASMAGTTLQLQRMQGDQVAEAYTLELTKGCTVQECLPTIADKAKMARLLEMLQLYACLCVAEAAATEPSPVATQGTAKQKKQDKAPAAAPDPAPAWDSIYTVTMRRTPPTGKPREEAAPEGPARRPHTRRAHWHNYWKGKKSELENRWLERKWVAEIAVNAAQKELPVRIVLIKQSSYVNLIQNKNQRG